MHSSVKTALSFYIMAWNAFDTQQLTQRSMSTFRCSRFHSHLYRSSSSEVEEDFAYQVDRRLALSSLPFISSLPILKTCSAITTPYDEYASTYDDLDGGPLAKALGIDDARSKLIQSAKGRVLEVGAGTGLNIDKYRFASDDEPVGVTSLTLVDVSNGMLRKAQDKIHSSTYVPKEKVHLVVADATTDLVKAFGVDQFDTVIDTFSL